jgi:hypothetical protein
MDATEGPVHSFTPQKQHRDSLIETIVVGHGERHRVELEQIPKCFYPVSGKNQTRGEAPPKQARRIILTMIFQICTNYITTMKAIIWATAMHMSTWALTRQPVQSSSFDQINVRCFCCNRSRRLSRNRQILCWVPQMPNVG